MQKIGFSLWDMTSHMPWFIRTYSVVVKARSSESGEVVQFPQGVISLSSPFAILCGTEPVSALSQCHALFYIADLSIIFSEIFPPRISLEVISHSQGFNQWLLTWTSFFHCVRALGVGKKPGLSHTCWPGSLAVIIDIVLPQSKSLCS